MSQDFPDIPSTTRLTDSRELLLSRDAAVRSSFTGTSFPSDPERGQFCYRSDQGKLYQCTDPDIPTWTQIALGVPVPLAQGGTGGTDGPTARSGLGLGAVAVLATISGAYIDDGAIVASKIGTGAVVEAKIGTGAVTLSKLASGVVLAQLGFTPANVAGQVFTGEIHGLGGVITYQTGNNVPFFSRYRQDTTPNDADVLGADIWTGRNDVGADITYFEEYGIAVDVSAGSEDGAREFWPRINGTLTKMLGIYTGVTIGDPSGSYMGAGSLNVEGGYHTDGIEVFPLAAASQDNETGSSTTGSVIPYDDTVPLVSEGAELCSVAGVTTTHAADLVEVRFEGSASVEGGGGEDDGFIVAIFRGSTCIRSRFIDSVSTTNGEHPFFGSVLDAPGSIAAFTYSMRIGPITSGGVVRWNGANGGRKLGGSGACSLRCQVIPVV